MELTAGLVWLLVAAALVLFMTPGLAFFYGGMTRAKSALNMMMMSFVAIGTVGIVWVLWGASMATSNEDNFFQIFANPFSHFGLARLHRTGRPAQGRLRGHLRHHHGGPDHRRRRRPRQVLRLGRLHPHLGHPRLRAAGLHGLGRRPLRPPSGCVRPDVRARSSTSPAAPWSTSTPASPA